MPTSRAARRIDRELRSWDGVTAEAHPPGGRAYRLGQRPLGQVPGDHLVEVALSPAARDEVIAAGLAEPHPTLHDSGWVSKPLAEEPDVEIALALLRRAYVLAREQTGGAQGGREPAGIDKVDKVEQAGRESFPASDPPAWNP